MFYEVAKAGVYDWEDYTLGELVRITQANVWRVQKDMSIIRQLYALTWNVNRGKDQPPKSAESLWRLPEIDGVMEDEEDYIMRVLKLYKKERGLA